MHRQKCYACHYTLFLSSLSSGDLYDRIGIKTSLGRIEAIAELYELAHKDTTRVGHILGV